MSDDSDSKNEIKLFDFINDISHLKKDLLNEATEREYSAYMVNRFLSMDITTIMYANEMNKFASIPKQWQFDFYRIGVPKRKRFSKWHKQDKIEEDVKNLMQEYNYSHQKALQVISILSDEQLEELRKKYKIGGR